MTASFKSEEEENENRMSYVRRPENGLIPGVQSVRTLGVRGGRDGAGWGTQATRQEVSTHQFNQMTASRDEEDTLEGSISPTSVSSSLRHPNMVVHPIFYSMEEEKENANMNEGALRLRRQQLRSNSTKPNNHHRLIGVANPRYEHYKESLAGLGLRIVPVAGDGNCLFRSVSHQVYGSDEHHALVRAKCMDYMEVEKDYFKPYIVGNMTAYLQYIQYKRQDAVWGDDPEIQAMSELYDRPAEVYMYDSTIGAKKLRTFHEQCIQSRHRPPIRLSFYGGGHYDSIVGTEHAQHLISEPPGVWETQRLSVTQGMRAAIQNGTSLSEAQQTEIALRLSREEFGSMNNNLDDLLQQSFDDYTLQQVMNIESKEIEEAKLSTDLVAVQATMIETAKKHSEEEQLKKALEESKKYSDEMGYLCQDDIEAAIQASLATSQPSFEDDLQRAIQLSSIEAQGSVDISEDEETQRAIQASLLLP